MATYRFNTNINCGGCIETVKPYLDQLEGIENWEVDTSDQNKILQVNSESLTSDQIKAQVEEAGFKIEKSGKGNFLKRLFG